MMKQIASQSLLERDPHFEPEGQPPLAAFSLVSEAQRLKHLLSGYERLDGRLHLLLDRSGTIMAMGERTQADISQIGCLAFVHDRLVASLPEAEAPVQRMLALSPGGVENLIVRCRQRDGHIILSGTGLCPSVILLSIHIASRGYMPKLVDLTEAFGLTPSEAHIVELLLGGHGPSKIGEELNISVHTVRAHLRHCYDKLGVSSREELWQTLAPYHVY